MLCGNIHPLNYHAITLDSKNASSFSFIVTRNNGNALTFFDLHSITRLLLEQERRFFGNQRHVLHETLDQTHENLLVPLFHQ